MSIAAPPPIPSVMPAHDHQGKPTAKPCGRGHRCAKAGAKKCAAIASSPTRGLVIVMVGAALIATIIAVAQLAQGVPGRMAANTLFAAAGFNLLFTAMYAPLLGLFTLRSGFLKALGTGLATLARGVALTLSLLFLSVAVLVGIGVLVG